MSSDPSIQASRKGGPRLQSQVPAQSHQATKIPPILFAASGKCAALDACTILWALLIAPPIMRMLTEQESVTPTSLTLAETLLDSGGLQSQISTNQCLVCVLTVCSLGYAIPLSQRATYSNYNRIRLRSRQSRGGMIRSVAFRPTRSDSRTP